MARLTDVQENAMTEQLKEMAPIYNKAKKDYKDVDKKGVGFSGYFTTFMSIIKTLSYETKNELYAVFKMKKVIIVFIS